MLNLQSPWRAQRFPFAPTLLFSHLCKVFRCFQIGRGQCDHEFRKTKWVLGILLKGIQYLQLQAPGFLWPVFVVIGVSLPKLEEQPHSLEVETLLFSRSVSGDMKSLQLVKGEVLPNLRRSLSVPHGSQEALPYR